MKKIYETGLEERLSDTAKLGTSQPRVLGRTFEANRQHGLKVDLSAPRGPTAML